MNREVGKHPSPTSPHKGEGSFPLPRIIWLFGYFTFHNRIRAAFSEAGHCFKCVAAKPLPLVGRGWGGVFVSLSFGHTLPIDGGLL